jgi:hypothetical protein
MTRADAIRRLRVLGEPDPRDLEDREKVRVALAGARRVARSLASDRPLRRGAHETATAQSAGAR